MSSLSLQPQSLHSTRRILSRASLLVFSQRRLQRSLPPPPSNVQHPPRLSALRAYSSTASRALAPAADTPTTDVPEPKLSLKWLVETKARIGKCIMFGLDAGQVRRVGDIMKVLASCWRELSAGSEGFLTGKHRESLCGQRVVWGEMDSMGHVNNVTYVRYAESGMINWAYNFAMHIDPANREAWNMMWTPKGSGLIMRSIKVDYKFPMTYPDKVSVYHKLRHALDYDGDAFILDVVILSEKHQRPAARCTVDVVMYDYKIGKKTKLPAFMAKAFMETFRLQEEAKKVNTDKVLAILSKVEALERETWDRSDAKEDIGSAA